MRLVDPTDLAWLETRIAARPEQRAAQPEQRVPDATVGHVEHPAGSPTEIARRIEQVIEDAFAWP
jgi:hypothetical protein